ncbi:TPA_asm: M [Celery gammacytorhabdovirus 1]|nr:TPA_asm: M [Celery gammacytorhabdovirus 1]
MSRRALLTNNFIYGHSPTVLEDLDSYSHIYVHVDGHIEVRGDSEITSEDLYSLIVSLADKEDFRPVVRDSLEILMWSIYNSTERFNELTIEDNVFFGPNSMRKKFWFPKNIFILSHRTSFKEEVEQINVKTEGHFELCGSDWLVNMNLEGKVKKLTKIEIIGSQADRVSMYKRSDKFNIYKTLSSETAMPSTDEEEE